MRIGVFGLGYVGCVSAAYMAQKAHDVLGVDVNRQKVDLINSGCAPVMEQGLDTLISNAVLRGSLRASFDTRLAVHNTDVSMICVGTPSGKNGRLDLQHVEDVCRQVGAALADRQSYRVVIVRSTVLPGTTEEVVIPLLEHCSGQTAGKDFGVAVNPEFLREGSAISDSYSPGLVVIGELDERSGSVVTALYEDVQAPTVRTTIRAAEMIKYASNAFHALKVVFANEIGTLCKAHAVDGRDVMEALCQDTRLNISAAYLKPGFAFGGSCLPKDLRALVYRAKERDIECPVLRATLVSNQEHVQQGIDLIEATGRKRIGVLGLSFKPGTDDVRESPIVSMVERHAGKGYSVSIYDERVELARLVGTNKAFLEREIPHIASLMCTSLEELLQQAEVIVLSHDDASFRRALQLIRSDQRLIDLAGIVRDDGDIRGVYEGICW